MKWKYMVCLSLIAFLMTGCGWFGIDSDTVQKDKEETGQLTDESSSDLVDSDWNIKVDESINHSNNYAAYIDTLKLDATKEFGTDGLGTYKGTIYLKVDHQLPSGFSGYNYIEFKDQPINFTLLPYNEQEYKAYETKYKQKLEESPLAPLADKLDAMCLVNVILNGQWQSSITSEAGTITKDEPASADLKIRIGIIRSIVWVDIIFADHSAAGFQGAITKHPVSNN